MKNIILIKCIIVVIMILDVCNSMYVSKHTFKVNDTEKNDKFIVDGFRKRMDFLKRYMNDDDISYNEYVKSSIEFSTFLNETFFAHKESSEIKPVFPMYND